jgi:adenosylhomocysteinase
MNYKIKDLKLAEKGRKKIQIATRQMPVLSYLEKLYEGKQPFKGVRIGGCLHVTKETAVLIKALYSCGADIAWCACNPLSTQDDVAAALVKDYEVSLYAWRGMTIKEYYECIEHVINSTPQMIIDDGADLHVQIHKDKYKEIIKWVRGGTEETTTGVKRLRALKNEGKLKYPIIAVNDAKTKWDFDNVYGTGQSVIDGILRATNTLIAGKTVVVAGYGHCGRGIAMRMKGMGANVIVTEVDPENALKAVMEGYRVMPMSKACKEGDIFITATGCKDVITSKHFEKMKDGAILANAGHFNVEISVEDLEKIAVRKEEVRPNNFEYTLSDGRKLYLLAEGRLVNLVAAEGHPSEVMDMSFSNQFLSLLYLYDTNLKPDVYDVPKEIDKKVAELKLKTLGIKIDKLSGEQKRYLKQSELGT